MTMELYYHKTDGGAEYYCTDYIECDNGHREGLVGSAILRTDGDEIEVYTKRLIEYGISLKIDTSIPYNL